MNAGSTPLDDASETRYWTRPQTKPILETGDDTACTRGRSVSLSGCLDVAYDIWKVGSSQREKCLSGPGTCLLPKIAKHKTIPALVICFLMYMLSFSLSLSIVVSSSPGVHFFPLGEILNLGYKLHLAFVSQSLGRTCSFLAGCAVPWFSFHPTPLKFPLPVTPRQTRREIVAEPPNRSSHRDCKPKLLKVVTPAEHCSMIL